MGGSIFDRITILRSGPRDERARALAELRAITDRDFGMDVGAWEAWAARQGETPSDMVAPASRAPHRPAPVVSSPPPCPVVSSPPPSPPSAPRLDPLLDPTRAALRGRAPLYHQQYGDRIAYTALGEDPDPPRVGRFLMFFFGPLVMLAVASLMLFQFHRLGVMDRIVALLLRP